MNKQGESLCWGIPRELGEDALCITDSTREAERRRKNGYVATIGQTPQTNEWKNKTIGNGVLFIKKRDERVAQQKERIGERRHFAT